MSEKEIESMESTEEKMETNATDVTKNNEEASDDDEKKSDGEESEDSDDDVQVLHAMCVLTYSRF